MNTFFAHHNAVHNSGNRALFVSALGVLLAMGLVVVLIKNGGDQ